MSPITVLTYNVFFNKALPVLPDIVRKYRPDIVCLQEVSLNRREEFRGFMPGYTLGATSDSFYRVGKVYGLANLYLQDRFYQVGSQIIPLPKSYYELFLSLFTRKGPRSVLGSTFVFKDALKATFSVYNVHLTHYVATNAARNKQINEVFDTIERAEDEPIIILGDFNYPFLKRGLARLIDHYDLREATSRIAFTEYSTLIRSNLKLDYILHSPTLVCMDTRRLDEYKGASDHYPILSTFDLETHAL